MKELYILAAVATFWAPWIWWLLREDLGRLPDGTDRITQWFL